jgi:hypothetical protein
MRWRRIRSRWADGAALLAGIVVAGALLECGLRIFEPFPVRVMGDRIVLATHREWRYRAPAGSLLVKSSRFYYGTIHFTNQGADRVAALVYRDLCPVLAARFPDRLTRPCEVPESRVSASRSTGSAH